MDCSQVLKHDKGRNISRVRHMESQKLKIYEPEMQILKGRETSWNETAVKVSKKYAVESNGIN